MNGQNSHDGQKIKPTFPSLAVPTNIFFTSLLATNTSHSKRNLHGDAGQISLAGFREFFEGTETIRGLMGDG